MKSDTFYPIAWFRQTFTFVSIDDSALVFDWVAEPGCFVGEHVHLDTVETFHLQEGELSFKLDGRPVPAGAGDVVAVDTGRRHAIRNRTDQAARARVSYSPLSDLPEVFQIFGRLSKADQGKLINVVKLFYLTNRAGLRPWATLTPPAFNWTFNALANVSGRLLRWRLPPE
jgi:quercetin dioxygenase-like cupin family protein